MSYRYRCGIRFVVEVSRLEQGVVVHDKEGITVQSVRDKSTIPEKLFT